MCIRDSIQYDASDNLMRIGVPALRILSVAYLLSIPGLIYQAALQGLSLGKESMYISMTRQAILPLVFAFLLKGFGNLNLIWGAFVPVSYTHLDVYKRQGVQSVYMKQDELTGMYYDYAMAAPLMLKDKPTDQMDVLILGMGTGTYATPVSYTHLASRRSLRRLQK